MPTEGGAAYDAWLREWTAKTLRSYALAYPAAAADPRWAAPLDGCTGVPDVCKPCCVIHDIHYRLLRILGPAAPKTRRQADDDLRDCIREHAQDEDRPWNRAFWHGLAWARWIGVRMFGGMHVTD